MPRYRPSASAKVWKNQRHDDKDPGIAGAGIEEVQAIPQHQRQHYDSTQPPTRYISPRFDPPVPKPIPEMLDSETHHVQLKDFPGTYRDMS